MVEKQLRADQLWPGIGVHVNDEWVPVDRLSFHEDGKMTVWWGGPKWKGERGIRCKRDTPFMAQCVGDEEFAAAKAVAASGR